MRGVFGILHGERESGMDERGFDGSGEGGSGMLMLCIWAQVY